jgi:cell division protein FtsZ
MSIIGHMAKLSDLKPKITVIGVGGAGCNAVNNMIASGLQGVDFVVANTDAQALASASTELRLQLGMKLTEGLGAGSRPEIGEAAAEEAVEDIRQQIEGSHMVFIAAGMGGGTGTGAAGVIARTAKELGILTVAVVTKPFLFEGARRMRIAEIGVTELRHYVDTLIVIPNQNLFRIASEKTTFSDAFSMADQVLYSGVACIVDLIIKEGLINLDFADVRTVMSGMGSAMMGTGEASGDRRATLAAEEAISNPLIDDVSLKGAKGLLLSITGGRNLTLYEVDEAASRVRQEVDPEANIIVGATFDETLGDRVRVSIVASGLARAGEADRAPPGSPEAWARGMKHAPAVSSPPQQTHYASQAAPVRPQAVAKPNPASEHAPAAAQERANEAPDMQRRLVEALQSASSRSSTSFGTPVQGRPAREDGRARGRESWQGPGNVTIEDGPPQLSLGQPPPLPESHRARGHDHERAAAEKFTPAAPANVRRGQRRMPDIEDFPPVAQRAYRAMEAMPPRDPRGGHDDGLSWGRHEEPRRLTLFERLAGRVLPTSDSPRRKQALPAPHAQDDYSEYGEHSEGYADEYDPDSEQDAQAHDVSGIFGRRRR